MHFNSLRQTIPDNYVAIKLPQYFLQIILANSISPFTLKYSVIRIIETKLYICMDREKDSFDIEKVLKHNRKENNLNFNIKQKADESIAYRVGQVIYSDTAGFVLAHSDFFR